MFADVPNIVFLLAASLPEKFTIKAKHEFVSTPYANIVGVLPGKSKANEYVIFSAHYDHVGVGKPINGDSIITEPMMMQLV